MGKIKYKIDFTYDHDGMWGADMRYIWTIIWALLISAAVSYVLTSMAAEPFNLTDTVVLAVIFTVVIFFMGDVVLKEKNE